MIKYAQGNAGKTHEFIFPKIKWKRRKSLWTHWKATLSQPIPGAKCRDRPTKIVGWGRRTWKGCLGDYWERHLATTHLMVKHRNSKPKTRGNFAFTFVHFLLQVGRRPSYHPLTPCSCTYFTHARTCDNVRVQSATQWTASVHTLHMPKPVITFVFKVLRNGLLPYILYTWPNLW